MLEDDGTQAPAPPQNPQSTLEAAMQLLTNGVTAFASALTSFLPGLQRAAESMETAVVTQNTLAEEIRDVRKADANKKLKPEAPAAFDRDTDKAEGFIDELDMYFDAMGVTDHHQKIIYAL